jgi:dipeptidase E
MKRLLLTSSGLRWKGSLKLRKEFLKLLDKPSEEIRVLVIRTVRRREDLKRINKVIKALKKAGIQKKNIIDANISKNIKNNKFKEKFDVIYFCGGNTFYILDRTRKTGFDKLIKQHINQGRLYVGVSAGSIIVHKTIEPAGVGKFGDKNDINLKNLTGLSLVNFAIFPHYKKYQEKEIKEFEKKANYKCFRLKDKQAILIKGNKLKKI